MMSSVAMAVVLAPGRHFCVPGLRRPSQRGRVYVLVVAAVAMALVPRRHVSPPQVSRFSQKKGAREKKSTPQVITSGVAVVALETGR